MAGHGDNSDNLDVYDMRDWPALAQRKYQNLQLSEPRARHARYLPRPRKVSLILAGIDRNDAISDGNAKVAESTQDRNTSRAFKKI